MGSHERDVSPDKAMNDLLYNAGEYQQRYGEYSKDVQARRGQGLPQNIKDIYMKQGKGMIGGQLRSGQQTLRESLAGTGSGVPVDALMKGLGGLQGNANTALAGLSDTVAMRDYDAQENNLNRGERLAGLELQNYATRAGILGQNQAFGIEATRAHNENQFSWGKLGGLLASAGGQMGGQSISRKGMGDAEFGGTATAGGASGGGN